MVNLKECHECGRRESKVGPLKNHRIRQPNGKFALMRLCDDCYEVAKWDGYTQ